MVHVEWRLLEPEGVGLQERSDGGGAAIQEFWRKVDVDTHHINVTHLGLFVINHQDTYTFSDKEVELHVFGNLHHDAAKKSSEIPPDVYFEPNMDRERVRQVFGDHAVRTTELLIERFPDLDPRVITQIHWHHPYSQEYKITYSDQLLDLSDPANEAAKHMTELNIVCDKVSAGVELRHGKTESKSVEEIMAIIDSEFAKYPLELGLSYDWIDVPSLIAEAMRVQHQPFSWSTIAHEMQVFSEQTGKSLQPLIAEFNQMEELVKWTLANYVQSFGQYDDIRV